MKSFKDLIFEPHSVMSGLMARMYFDNGYGISVVRFKTMSGCYGSYTDNESEWEVAVLEGNEDESSLTYDTTITDDVIGHLSDSEVTKIMKAIQLLKPVVETINS